METSNAIFEASPIGMIAVDNQGRIVIANSAALTLFGYTNDELKGSKLEILAPQRFRQEHQKLRDKFFENPEKRGMGAGRDLFGLHKNGCEIPLEIGLTPLELDGQNLTLCTIIDLTGRLQMESELREAAVKMRGLYDKSSNFIGLMNTDGVLIDANRTALAAAGVEANEVLNMPFWETPWWAHSEELREKLKQAIQSAAAGESIRFEATHPTPDGSIIFVDFSLHPVMDRDGKVAFLIPEGQNITEHKLREEALAELNTSLSTSNEALEQFAYVASHDLQEPLRKIASYAELLREDCGDQINADGHHFLDIIEDGAGRLKTLVSDLLAFSQIKTHPSELKPTDAEECLKTALENLEVVIGENDARITSNPLPSVMAEQTQLTILFQNLVGNAIKYRREELPEIHVSALKLGAQVEFTVKDNGIGIEREHSDRVFDIFKRLHGRQKYTGTGIGLAICKRVVDGFGGKIWVVPAENGGSAFRFTVNKS